MRTKFYHLNPGRNDPCPCGSGKKYKKCCIDKPWEPSPELLEDFALGEKLLAEFEKREEEAGRRPLRNNSVPKLSKNSMATLLTGISALTFNP